MPGLDVILRAPMHHIPRRHRTHNRDLVERAGQVRHDSEWELQVIFKAANVEVARRPRAFFGVEGVNLAHPAVNVDEKNLSRRGHRFDFFFSADVERTEGVEITADQTDAADAKEFAASKRWDVSSDTFHDPMNLIACFEIVGADRISIAPAFSKSKAEAAKQAASHHQEG